MKKYNTKKINKSWKENVHEYMTRRQAANYERFMQEKADVFQVTEKKDQALFWTMN
ncbi:hypothetical protein [Acutalibacter sp. 1XD8-33]|uniref:hypothetical protein n=1 Tax=Acutalibacter sp. 1XD8-33 TaxID=2320081 RepID=UPI001313EC22|nr:hypothetical protein [Acutalibacter sp. 1XD8-33]